MKKFIDKLLVLVLLLVGLDICFGMVMDDMYQHAKSGTTSKSTYIANKTNEDVLIFGSSRAVHHYNPQIIEDSLGMSCYNCGYDGNGILLNYGYYQMIIERYAPKVIVYDVIGEFDFLPGDNLRFLKGLRPFYKNNMIREYIAGIDNIESIKDFSSFYRYNGIAIQVMLDFIKQREAPLKGFLPINVTMVKEPTIDDMPEYHVDEMDIIKMRYLSSFIDLCRSNGIRLILIVSPLYKRTNSNEYEPVKNLAKEKDVIFLDNVQFNGNNTNSEYFYDAVHLTAKGADEYTRLFIEQLKNMLKQE